jgi:hypothetical protein
LETGNWVEQDLGFTQLAAVLGPQLKCIQNDPSGLKNDFRWYNISINNKVFYFGYCTYHSEKEKVYEIFASNRRYMFTLIKKGRGRWQILLMPGTKKWAYDKKYLEIVPYLLELGNI